MPRAQVDAMGCKTHSEAKADCCIEILLFNTVINGGGQLSSTHFLSNKSV